MEDDKNWLESVLKRRAYEESPLRVLEAESAAAVGKNENYLSNLTKMKVAVLLGSGKIRKMTVMVKNQHTGAALKQFSTALGVFFREIAMYRDVLPKMEDLMEEFGFADEPMWAKCYDVRLYDRLVLEDLTARGYKMAKRIEQLTTELQPPGGQKHREVPRAVTRAFEAIGDPVGHLQVQPLEKIERRLRKTLYKLLQHVIRGDRLMGRRLDGRATTT